MAEFKLAPDFEAQGGVDTALYDAEIMIPLKDGGATNILARHVGYSTSGVIERADNSPSVIQIMNVDLDNKVGLYATFTPDEARSLGEALIQMSDEAYRASMDVGSRSFTDEDDDAA